MIRLALILSGFYWRFETAQGEGTALVGFRGDFELRAFVDYRGGFAVGNAGDRSFLGLWRTR